MEKLEGYSEEEIKALFLAEKEIFEITRDFLSEEKIKEAKLFLQEMRNIVVENI